MNDCETRRYDMFGRVQTFGKDNATDFAAMFIAYELPSTFVQDLKDDLSAIREADAATNSDDQEGVSSTAGVGRLIKAGMAEVTQVDCIMRNNCARNPDKLTAWDSASHIERAPKREKKLAGGGNPPAPKP
ncbi:MAG: hypothetical protein K8R23_00040 [Chthoniobacter sp.]|nr:hypothetical protein [Chthoniobacter sp.]